MYLINYEFIFLIKKALAYPAFKLDPACLNDMIWAACNNIGQEDPVIMLFPFGPKKFFFKFLI